VIGGAIARGLASAGADLVIVARRRAPLEAAAEALSAETGRLVIALTADIGDPASRSTA
jgi:short-subunit dehydrogenase